MGEQDKQKIRDGLERLRSPHVVKCPKATSRANIPRLPVDTAQADTTNGSKGKSPAMDSVSALMNFWKPPENISLFDPPDILRKGQVVSERYSLLLLELKSYLCNELRASLLIHCRQRNRGDDC